MNQDSLQKLGVLETPDSVATDNCSASNSSQKEETQTLSAPNAGALEGEVSVQTFIETVRRMLAENIAKSRAKVSVGTLVNGYRHVSVAQAVGRIIKEVGLTEDEASYVVDIIAQADLLKDHEEESKGKHLEGAIQQALREFGFKDYEHDMYHDAGNTGASAFVDFVVYGMELNGAYLVRSPESKLVIEAKFVGCGVPDSSRAHKMDLQTRIEGLVAESKVALLVYGNEQALFPNVFDMVSLRSSTIDEAVVRVNERLAEKAKQPRPFTPQYQTQRQEQPVAGLQYTPRRDRNQRRLKAKSEGYSR